MSHPQNTADRHYKYLIERVQVLEELLEEADPLLFICESGAILNKGRDRREASALRARISAALDGGEK